MKKHLLLLFTCLIVFTVAKAQPGFINTIAGGGVGDNSLAVNANLQLPFCLAVDKFGNVYIDDLVNQRIRKITLSTGIISTVAGNGKSGYAGDEGPATAAELYYPRGVAVDTAGNIYIADAYNNRIRKVDGKTGVITTAAGGGTGKSDGDGGKAISAVLDEPWGVAVDKTGNIYIVDTYHNRIREVDIATGIINTVAGDGNYGSSGDGGPATDAQIGYDAQMTVDTAGNLFIADETNCTVREVNAITGIINTVAGTGGFGESGDGGAGIYANFEYTGAVAVDDSENMYIADIYGTRVRKVTAYTGIINTFAGNGQYGYSSDGGLADTTRLYEPTGVAVNLSTRNVYIADFENSRIRQVDTNGIITTIAGGAGVGDGGSALSAALSYPVNVAVDKSDNVYIADMENNRVRKVTTSTGIISTVAGNGIGQYNNDGGLADTSSLYLPTGVAFDDSENVYVLCSGDARLRKVNALTGIISTIAGDGSQGYTGDNIHADSAEFYFLPYIILNLYYSYPVNYGVTLDKQGNIYVADGNNRIREINATTNIITTVAGDGTPGVNGDGGLATNAQLDDPTNVAFDDSGNMYIADFGNYRVRKVEASTGIITTVAGGGITIANGVLATNALIYPAALAIDTLGNLYVTNWYNNMVQQVDLNTGIINAVAGIAIEGYSGDGGLAKNAEVNYPYGVALDGNRNIYIADTYNNVVREVKALPIQSAGIDELTATGGVSVYPNPASNNLNINFGTGINSGNAAIRITDVTGREVLVMNKYITSGSTLTFDVSSLTAGMYFVTLNIGQYSAVAKVVKQ